MCTATMTNGLNTATTEAQKVFSLADVDAISEAIDKLEFIRAALTDCDAMGNDSANNGLAIVMGEALDVLAASLDGIIR